MNQKLVTFFLLLVGIASNSQHVSAEPGKARKVIELLFSDVQLEPEVTLGLLKQLDFLYSNRIDTFAEDWDVLIRQYIEAGNVSEKKCDNLDTALDLSILLLLDIGKILSDPSPSMETYIKLNANQQFQLCKKKFDLQFHKLVDSLNSERKKAIGLLMDRIELVAKSSLPKPYDQGLVKDLDKLPIGTLGLGVLLYMRQIYIIYLFKDTHNNQDHPGFKPSNLPQETRHQNWLRSTFDLHVKDLCLSIKINLNQLANIYEPYLEADMIAHDDDFARDWVTNTKVCSVIVANRDALFRAVQDAWTKPNLYESLS